MSGIQVPAWLAGSAVILLLAAIGLAIFAIIDRGQTTTTTRVVTTSASAAAPAPTPTASSGFAAAFTDARPTDAPFELGGVRWAVFVDPDQPWTAFTRTAKPGKDRRWLTVSVRLRNLRRPGLRAEQLPVMLIAENGRGFAPDARFGSGPKVRAGAGTVQVGKTAQVELAYRVPEELDRFTLRLATRSFGGEPITVALRTG